VKAKTFFKLDIPASWCFWNSLWKTCK